MKKILAFILSVILLFGMLPLGTFTATAETSGFYTYTVSNGEATITKCNTSIGGDIIIPSELGGYPVTSIGDNAFSGCENLTSISIPDSITNMGSGAFYNCSSLENVYYTGSQNDKNNISISDNNKHLIDATWHYNQSTDLLVGDINSDGVLGNRDLSAMSDILLKKDDTKYTGILDMNNDGKIDVIDSVLLRKAMASNLNELFSASATLGTDSLHYGTLANDVILGNNDVGAMLPATVKVENGAQNLALSVKKTETGEEIVLGKGDKSQSLDVHISGVAADNKVPMIVNLGAILKPGISDTQLKIYHTENGVAVLMTRVNSADEFALHNQYTYNELTGEVSIYVSSFSVFSAVQTTVSKWDGESVADKETWYDANAEEYVINSAEEFVLFRDLVDESITFEGKTVKLAVDIDLGGYQFDPIGFGYESASNQRVFKGTFDGQGHTVYNLAQNGWELDSDKTNYSTYTYSTAGGGLFASIKNATIKNLAVSGANIVFECIDMGIVVGYAQGTCHFENIIVTNSKIANYNRATGAVVGEVCYGPYGTDTSLGYSHTFKNITVDSSVKVSSLWGSFDTLCGGVIGGKWGDATVKMENITVACELDVFSDVTAAYRWYAYRRCGMLIGNTEQSDPNNSHAAYTSFLTCENVNVYYGEWVNYTYFEFADQDSGTGRTYPWVRAEAGEHNDAFSNPRYGVPTYDGVKVTDGTKSTDSADITFGQLYGGGQGVYGRDNHEGVVVTNLSKKTIYVKNTENVENLKLKYWFMCGEDVWTTVSGGISMDTMLVQDNVYRIDLPVYVHSFKISGTDYEGVEILNANIEEGATYDVNGNHVHVYVDDKCVCGYALNGYELTFGANGSASHKDGTEISSGKKYIDNGFTITITSPSKVYDGAFDEKGNSCLKLGTSSVTGTFTFQVPENVTKVVIYAAKYKTNASKLDVNGTTYTLTKNSDDGEYDEIVIDTTTNEAITVTTVSGGLRCMIDKIVLYVPEFVHDCDQAIVIEGFDATCTKDGLTDGAQCSVCGEITLEQEVIEALGHDCGDDDICERCGENFHEHAYVETGVAPTCTEPGYTTFTCRCGDTYTENYEATGHNYAVNGFCTSCKEEKPAEPVFTVHFLTPEGAPTVDPIICGEGNITFPSVEAPEGYSFLGWAKDPTTHTTTPPTYYVPGATFPIKEGNSRVFYALYTYDVKVEIEEGESTDTTVSSVVSLSFANATNRTTYTTTQQIWEQNGIKLTNNKASSTTNVGNYSNPARFYASSQVIIQCAGMTQIVFNCYNTTYASDLGGSITNGTAVVSGKVVTVTFTEAVDSFEIAKLTKQVRIDSIDVTADSTNSGSTGTIVTTYYTTIIGDSCLHASYNFNNGADATCTEDGKYADLVCDDCGEILWEGTVIEAKGHAVDGDKCLRCGEKCHEHSYVETITEPKCTEGGYTTYTCNCGESYIGNEVDALGHNYIDGTCERCGEEDNTSTEPIDTTYTFANYTAGTQYADDEEHKLNDNVTVVTTDAHFTSELRLYSSSTYNGYAIIKSTDAITKLGVNAGNKADTLVIYGSNDEGATWKEIGEISVTSTSYKDYTLDFEGEYNWLKIDVKGTNQVRLKSMTLTTVS